MDPEVREMLEAATPAVTKKLISAALNESGDVPYRFQQTAQLAVLDRVYGKPEQRHKVSGQVNYVQILAEFTQSLEAQEQKAIEGECEVLDPTQDAIHSDGAGEKSHNNS